MTGTSPEREPEHPPAAHLGALDKASGSVGPTVLMVSLEDWDDTWRRNQHLARRLLDSGAVGHVIYVAPPNRKSAGTRHPEVGVTVVVPPMALEPRFGGIWLAGLWVRRRWLQRADLLWINNAPVGRWLLSKKRPALYDVTDDWRFSAMGWATRRRLLRAESVLARKARTVVCSDELAARWQDRFHVKAAVVRNGVDVDAVRSATPRQLEEPGPHAAYVGTLHDERLDVDLVLALALSGCVNRIHLVGPDHLEPQSRSRLLDTGRVSIPGPARRDEVPGWLQAADVLLLPHRISPFTLSLDAIKAHEYLATQKPIVATPTSGFQGLQPTPGLTVTTADRFGDAVSAAVELGPTDELRVVADWDDRAREFGAIIAELMASGDQAI